MTRLPARGPAVVMTCAVLALTGGCGSTSPDPSGYREQAALSVGTAISEVASTRLYLGELAQDDVFHTSATSQILASDRSLGSTASSFESLNPPPGSEPLRRRCSSLLGDAQDLVAAARIAVHRDDSARYPTLIRQLARLGNQLDRLESRLPS